MCGFVGIGNYTKTAITLFQRDAFKNALVADSARGMDGTGVVRIDEEGVATWAKAAGNPFDLFRTPNFISGFWSPVVSGWTRWLYGHNRLKTNGEAINKNAHPFQHGDILLAHNGTLRSGSIPELNQFDVDSEAICKSISVRGIEETLQRIDSAYCFVYYNSKEKTLNIIRNKERPMFVGIDKKTKFLAFGSEQSLMEWALIRNGQYISSDRFVELTENVLYTWTMEELIPSTKELKVYQKPKGKKKYKTGSESVMWINGEQWVKGENEVYHKVDQITETTSEAVSFSENNYPPVSPSSWFPNKHASNCICLVCHPPKTALTTTTINSGKVFSTENYLGLKKGEMANFLMDDYEELTKPSTDSSTEKAYIVQGFNPKHKGFLFKCRVKGEDSLNALIDADSIRGKIVSLLINKAVEENRVGVVYLNFPEPDWDLKIPDHAFENIIQGE